jgi:hypothetical protein
MSTACTPNLPRVERSALRPKIPLRNARDCDNYNGRPRARVRAAIERDLIGLRPIGSQRACRAQLDTGAAITEDDPQP